MVKYARHALRNDQTTTRRFAAGDPLRLVADPELGNSEWMLECIVRDFAGLGFDADELTNLLRSPAYPMLNQLLDQFGQGEIRRRINSLLTSSGVCPTRDGITKTPAP